MSDWTSRLWSFEKHYQSLGGSVARVSATARRRRLVPRSANKKHGRLSVTIQGDGDFLYAPGVWWTAAHHRIPLLAVMHNNRAYHQEVIARAAHGQPAHPAATAQSRARTSARGEWRDSTIRTWISRRLRRDLAVHAQGPNHQPERSRAGDSSARSTSSNAVSRRSSTSSRSRAVTDMKDRPTVCVLRSAVYGLWSSDRRGRLSTDTGAATERCSSWQTLKPARSCL
jgi:hypothetical protein